MSDSRKALQEIQAAVLNIAVQEKEALESFLKHWEEILKMLYKRNEQYRQAFIQTKAEESMLTEHPAKPMTEAQLNALTDRTNKTLEQLNNKSRSLAEMQESLAMLQEDARLTPAQTLDAVDNNLTQLSNHNDFMSKAHNELKTIRLTVPRATGTADEVDAMEKQLDTFGKQLHDLHEECAELKQKIKQQREPTEKKAIVDQAEPPKPKFGQ